MATVAHQPSQARPPFVQERRTMSGGLLWAAIVLGLLTWWLAARFWDSDATLAVVLSGALAALAFVLAIWTFLAPSSQEVALKQKRTLGVALLVGCAALVLLAIWLFVQQGLNAFPEFSGAILMALVALGTSLTQLARPGEPSLEDRILQALIRARQAMTTGMFVLAAACAGGAIWLIVAKEWLVVYPEAIGLVLVAVILAGAGLWLAIAKPEDVTPDRLRVLILIAGGLTGLAITLATVLRIRAWWSTVFAAGVSAWQGPEAWQLWICIYAVLAGLAIMFGSLLLARADIRSNAVMRRLLYGYNALLTGLLMLALLIVLNVMVYASYPYTFDWTQTRGIHTLSTSSKNLLEALKEPARVYVLMSQNDPLTTELRQLLENVSAYSDKLKVQYVSPERDAYTYIELAKKYPEVIREERVQRGQDDDGGRGILLVYGPESDRKAPHALIPRGQLMETKAPNMRGGKETRAFKGEDAIMTQLRFLANNQNKPKVYFTQGNGELNIADATGSLTPSGIALRPSGDALLVDRLKKDNYEVRGLVWRAPPQKALPGDLMAYSKKDISAPDVVPEDAKIVVIAGPQKPFSRSVIEALERYLQANGKLIVLSNLNAEVSGERIVYQPTGLEALLRNYGVELTGDFILNYPVSKGQSPVDVLVNTPEHSRNKIALNFPSNRYVFKMKLARTVRPGSSPAGFVAEPLLEVELSDRQPAFWTETDWNHLGDLIPYLNFLAQSGQLKNKISKEPLPVAVAVSDREQKPRLVVFGDFSFASNVVALNAPYYDFMISCMEWLAERPANIGIKPKESSSYVLGSNVNYARMIWLPLGLMVLTIVGAGTGVWVVRRR